MVDTSPVATERLMAYWAEGEGAAKIGWDSPGDYDRCLVQLGKYVRPDEVHGLCANLHKRATGAWPGHAPGDKGIEGGGMIYTKAVALVDTVETDDPNGAFEVVLSAATLDRDGEVIDSRAFDPLPDHIPFDIDHGMTVATTVGSGSPYYAEDGSLRVKGTFASTSLAQEVRTLVSEGHVRTTSVTFMAAERTTGEKGVQHVTKAELLNGTFTPVPSNRESVVLSAKALRAATDEKVGARNSTSDASTIQAAHDLLMKLGASCQSMADSNPKSHTEDPDVKSAPDQVGLKVDPENVDAAMDEPSADTTTEEAAAPAAAESVVESAEGASEEQKALASAIENAAHFAFGG